MLTPDAWEDWLFAPAELALEALAQAAEPDLVFHPVGKAVGSPKNDGPDLVEPIAS
jgi:putative SOS response-associated peptidase YedK